MSAPASRRFVPALLLLALAAAFAPAQVTPEQAANMLLASARRAYNEKNHAFAAARFRDFLARHPGHKEIASARLGLALCLLEGSARDYDKALEQLNQLTGNKALPEQALGLYYAGLARRGQGLKALDLGQGNVARDRFEDAAKQFAAAASAFSERAKDAKAPAKGVPLDLEWAARARCDRAEMLLRLRKAKEAREAVAPLVRDKKMAGSRYRGLSLYYHGFASFLLGDHMAAGKSLGQLAPFRDPVFGTHARYLLARVHHLDTRVDEREEARGHYQGVLKDHEEDKKAAALALTQPARFNNDPVEKARLTRLAKGPPPDHVARAMFFLGVLQYENGRFGDAQAHFKNFADKNATSPLAAEARLRQGFCQVQVQQFKAAIDTLQPLAEKNALLADQALLWIGKAHLGQADPKKPDSYKSAIDFFRKSAEKAQQRASATPPDAGAKQRKGEALMELAGAQQLARQFREAAGTYNQVLNEKLLPGRVEEVMQQVVTTYQLAGDYAESDKACVKFREAHPKSTLLPIVLFRHAENAYFLALSAEKLANAADRAREVAKHNDEAIKRYKVVIEKFPELAQVNLARYGLAMAHYRKGELEEAQKALEAIPAAERNGELAIVPYQLAGILIRQAPARADDAIAAGKLEEALKSASELLDTFVSGQPASPQAPDALLKLGHCQARMAALQAQPAEKARALAAARSAYEKLLQRFPKHALAPQAKFERAKVLAQARDFGGAMNELRAFTREPLNKSAIAPMALLHLATLHRGQNQPAEAVKVMAECRKEHEAALAKDAARSSWVSLLQYHHAVALREAGKLSEASALFDQVAKNYPDRPEAWESALRSGQCQKDAAEKKLEGAERQLANPGLKGEARTTAENAANSATNSLRDAVRYLSTQSDALKTRKPAGDDQAKALAQVRARMLYESAWGHRTLAEREVKKALKKVQIERWQKLRDEAARTVAPGQPVPHVALPEVALSEVPVQPAEKEARARYGALIEAFPDVTINADARFELAELLAQRGEHKEAVKLLQDAIEKEPPQELTDRIKVRLGATYLDQGARRAVLARRVLAARSAKAADKEKAKKELEESAKDIELALEQLQPVAENAKSALVAQATYREAERYLHLGKRDEAIKRLSKFRDHAPFQRLPGISDRALLRLGMALGEEKKWEPSRQAYEALVANFGGSPWLHEARYGIGWARQNQGQYEEAVNAYNQVTNAVVTELAARAQLNIGLCRLSQKRYAEATTALLVVPFTYDYPELSALALLEAARALAENKQTAQAVRLLKRVLRDHPNTAAAPAARKRLADLGEG